MIFAIICEELGLFGAISVILIFLFMIYRFMLIAGNAPDLFGALLVVGVMAHIAIQVILNIAVVTNVIPNTGTLCRSSAMEAPRCCSSWWRWAWLSACPTR